MTSRFTRLREMAHMMVGLPSYDGYCRHMAEHHPDRPVMTATQFFRNRQDARYKGGNGRCC